MAPSPSSFRRETTQQLVIFLCAHMLLAANKPRYQPGRNWMYFSFPTSWALIGFRYILNKLCTTASLARVQVGFPLGRNLSAFMFHVMNRYSTPKALIPHVGQVLAVRFSKPITDGFRVSTWRPRFIVAWTSLYLPTIKQTDVCLPPLPLLATWISNAQR